MAVRAFAVIRLCRKHEGPMNEDELVGRGVEGSLDQAEVMEMLAREVQRGEPDEQRTGGT